MLLDPLSFQDQIEAGPGSVIAVDLGRGLCRGVLADLTGEVLAEDDRLLPPRHEPALVLVSCVARLRRAAVHGQSPVRSVVVGIPAPAATGSRGTDLRHVLAEHVFEPLRVEPDVNLAALGHAARDPLAAHLLTVTLDIGTRIGGAAVAGGRLLEGWHDADGGTAWLPGSPVGLDRLATAPAIARRADELLARRAIPTGLRPGSSAADVLTAAAGHDPLALHVVHETLDHLALVLIAIVRALQPRRLVLDGSVGRGLEPHLAALRERLSGAVATPPDVQVASSDGDAGLSGAIAAARQLAHGHRLTEILPSAPGRTEGLGRATREKILCAVDPDEALGLLRTAVAVPSEVGDELLLAGIMAGELHGLGFDDVTLDEFAPRRASAWGTLHGTGGGDGLLLLGHLDTAGAAGWEERWRDDPREDPCSAVVFDGQVWGRGAADGKAAMVAALAAVGALRRAGLRPRGDLRIALLADEKRGRVGTGRSAGMKALMVQLRASGRPRPAFAVGLGPTGLATCPAQLGFLAADLLVRRPPGKRVDTRAAVRAVARALQDHGARLGQSAVHPLLGRPTLVLTRIDDGHEAADPDARPIRLVRTLVPGEDHDGAAAELEAVVAAAGVDAGVRVEFAYRAGRDHPRGGRPFETSPRALPVTRLRAAVESVRPRAGAIRGAMFWSEASFLADAGIPAAYFGPGDRNVASGHEERVAVDEFLDAVRALALFIAEHCGVEPAA
jgi:acetylornithine deacetylase